MSNAKFKSAGQLNNGYYVDEQALESLMKKILQQQENLRRDVKVAKLESILDIEVRNSYGKRPACILAAGKQLLAASLIIELKPLTNHYLVDPTHKVLEDLNLFKF